MADETVNIKIRLQRARQAANEFNTLNRSIARTGMTSRLASRGFLALGRGARVGAAGLGILGGFALRGAITGFMEADKVAAQTNAVIKSTGGVANVSAKRVGALATSLQNQSGMSDELIQSGSNLLLTFKNVRNEAGKGNKIFDRATQSALDLSVAGFGSVESTAKQMGKALNDPVKGITALGRAGVTFTKGQKETIKKLTETGHILDAQKMILKEVESQVGGSAKAYGRTLPGALGRMKETIGNALELLGGKLAPSIIKVSNFLRRLGSAFMRAREGGHSFGDALALALGRVTGSTGKVMGVWERIQKVGGWVRRVFGNLIDAGKNLAGIFAGGVSKNGSKVEDVIKKVGEAVEYASEKLVDFTKWLSGSSKGAKIFKGAILVIIGAFVTYKTTVGVITIATKAWAAAQVLLNAALTANPIGLIVVAIVALGVGLVMLYRKSERFRNIVQFIWGWLKRNWPLLLTIILGPIGAAVAGVIRHWDRVKAGVIAMYNVVVQNWEKIKGVVMAGVAVIGSYLFPMWEPLRAGFKAVMDWVISKWNGLTFKVPGFKMGSGKNAVKFAGAVFGTSPLPLVGAANGGVIRQKGSVMVGERGPEIVDLPRSARVIPLPKSERLNMSNVAGAGGGEITIRVPVMLDGRQITEVVGRHVQNRLARR